MKILIIINIYVKYVYSNIIILIINTLKILNSKIFRNS